MFAVNSVTLASSSESSLEGRRPDTAEGAALGANEGVFIKQVLSVDIGVPGGEACVRKMISPTTLWLLAALRGNESMDEEFVVCSFTKKRKTRL